jgi:oligoribonuclease
VTTPKFAVVDLETSGLVPGSDIIFEVGCHLLDEQLNVVDTFHSYVNDHSAFSMIAGIRHHAHVDLVNDPYCSADPDAVKDAKFIWNMHGPGGSMLFHAMLSAEYTRSVNQVQELLEGFLYKHGMRSAKDDDEKGIPVILVGSSIHFDAEFLHAEMEGVMDHFYHRRLDVSAFKVAVDTWMPEMREAREQTLTPQKLHRVIPDIEDTIDELRWYLQHVARTSIGG